MKAKRIILAVLCVAITVMLVLDVYSFLLVSRIKPGMRDESVFRIMGQPDPNPYFNSLTLEWRLPNGKYLYVSFQPSYDGNDSNLIVDDYYIERTRVIP